VTTTRVLVRCDGAPIPAALAGTGWSAQRSITTRGASANLAISAQSLAATVLTRLNQRQADLVRLAAYVYAADQEISRGGQADVYGRQWRREIFMCIPVADPTFWMRDALREHLATALSFLTDDRWDFTFTAAPLEHGQLPITVGAAELLGRPDSVILLSGGADSLCAAISAVTERGERPVIVSHRPAPHLDARQKRLVDGVRRRLPGWEFPHLSFAIHRMGSDAAETSQRSRAFLYACLGIAVAGELGAAPVHLPDNGIVSLNLPMSAQLVGALASRATHPMFLHQLNGFVRHVFPGGPQISNPLWARTRPEVLSVLAGARCEDLLQETVSCSHARGRPSVTPHCGYCSQCVDRRFGSIAASLGEHDLAERYGLDIFKDALPEGEAKTVAESYVRFARTVHDTPDELLFETFPQLFDCLVPTDRAAHETAQALVALLKRHARSVLNVLATMIARLSPELASGRASDNSLVGLAVVRVGVSSPAVKEPTAVFQRTGDYWTLKYRGSTAHIEHRAGMAYLHRLLAHPCHSFHVRELLAGGAGDIAAADPPARRQDLAAPRSDDLRILTDFSAEPILDARAKAELRTRLQELEDDIQEANQHNNPERVARAQAEFDQILDILRASQGFAGRDRSMASDTERARKAVSAAMHRALAKIAQSHAELHRHLDRSVTIGVRCSYEPDSATHWMT